MRVKCADCGEEHDLSEGEIGYSLPDAFFALSEGERKARGWADPDLCQVENRHFIRGALMLPVRGESREFAWGVWAEVGQTSFDRYRELYSDPAQAAEPPFGGRLANELPGYPSTIGLEVEVRLVSAAERPHFRVIPIHPLEAEQREGIPLERVLELMSPFIHSAGT